MNLRQFAERLKEAKVGHDRGRIRHRLAARPCPYARRLVDENAGRVTWEFTEEALAWWLEDLEHALEERRVKSVENGRTLRARTANSPRIRRKRE